MGTWRRIHRPVRLQLTLGNSTTAKKESIGASKKASHSPAVLIFRPTAAEGRRRKDCRVGLPLCSLLQASHSAAVLGERVLQRDLRAPGGASEHAFCVLHATRRSTHITVFLGAPNQTRGRGLLRKCAVEKLEHMFFLRIPIRELRRDRAFGPLASDSPPCASDSPPCGGPFGPVKCGVPGPAGST